MNRSARLAQRRLELLARCAAQRDELAVRCGALQRGPLGWLRTGAAALGRFDRSAGWLVAAAGLLAFGRTRRVVWAIGWAQAALSLVSRATQLVNAVGALRRAR